MVGQDWVAKYSALLLEPDVDGSKLEKTYGDNEFSSVSCLKRTYEDNVFFIPLSGFIDWVKLRGMTDKSILLQIINKKIADVRKYSDEMKKVALDFKAAIKDIKCEQVQNEVQNKEYAGRVAQNVVNIIDSIEYPDYYSNEQLAGFINLVKSCRRQIYKDAVQYIPKLDRAFKEPMRPLDTTLAKWEETHNQLTLIVVKFGEDCHWLGKNLETATKLFNTYVGLTEKFFQHREIRNNYQVAMKVYVKTYDNFKKLESNEVLVSQYECDTKCKKSFNFLRDEVNQLGKISKRISSRGANEPLQNKPESGINASDFGLIDKYCHELQADLHKVLAEMDGEEFFTFLHTLDKASQAGCLDDILDSSQLKKAHSLPERISKDSFLKYLSTYKETKQKLIEIESNPEFMKLVKTARQNRRDLRLATEQLKLKRNEIQGYIVNYRGLGDRLAKVRAQIHDFLKETFEGYSMDTQVDYKYWEQSRDEVIAEMASEELLKGSREDRTESVASSTGDVAVTST